MTSIQLMGADDQAVDEPLADPWWKPVVGVIGGLLALAFILYFGFFLGVGFGLYWAWLHLSPQAWRGELAADGEVHLRSVRRKWRFHLEDVQSVALEEHALVPHFVIRTVGGKIRLSRGPGQPIIDEMLTAAPHIEAKGFRHAGQFQRGLQEGRGITEVSLDTL